MPCELCENDGGSVLWRDRDLRVVYVDEPGYSGYCRVIWNAHVAEMTDLDDAGRSHCMRAVYATELLLREWLKPDKINLASLGNFTPHLHWHVIARFRNDAHFPQSIWGERQRAVTPLRTAVADLQQHLRHGLATRLAN
jgi:diadenosine tetraphosphate (Ap4A) HIT family hydrolase